MLLFTSRFSRACLAAFLSLAFLSPLPGFAIANDRDKDKEATTSDTVAVLAAAAGIDAVDPQHLDGPPLGDIPSDEKPILIAQACDSCGAELGALAVGSQSVSSGKKDKSVMTDSLWGNLILEMAYQRDPVIRRIAKGLGIVSLGTTAMIGAIAGGTLGQGISALQTLNPPEGHLDSYTPGIIGVTLSGCTLLTFANSIGFRKYLNARLHKRQIALKEQVETILAHLEYSHASCTKAENQLTELIGKRACNEWLQLWRSSHQVAMTQPPKISLSTESNVKGTN